MRADAAEPLLQIRNLVKEYSQAGEMVTALRLNFLDAWAGEALAVTGPSGSGKSTLLRLLAALIHPTQGSVRFAGCDVSTLGKDAADWRARTVGYVFQEMNLLPDFNLLENLLIAGEISRMPPVSARKRAIFLLERLGLAERIKHRPAALSLGEQQRAAAARAVLHQPALLLADEPSASLDAANAAATMTMLLELCAESNSLLVTATHDEELKKLFPRHTSLRSSERPDGRSGPEHPPKGQTSLEISS